VPNSADSRFELAVSLGLALSERSWTLAVAESCTGGGISQAVTDVAGSSAWFDRGFVTYSNRAKVEMLEVGQTTLDTHGAVSAETALEMAAGALKHSIADLAVAVTGIAGPGGGTPAKPVGTVFIAWNLRGCDSRVVSRRFAGDRMEIRRQVIACCLQLASEAVAAASALTS
jgi:nicotinamide-nucleotide amidase